MPAIVVTMLPVYMTCIHTHTSRLNHDFNGTLVSGNLKGFDISGAHPIQGVGVIFTAIISGEIWTVIELVDRVVDGFNQLNRRPSLVSNAHSM